LLAFVIVSDLLAINQIREHGWPVEITGKPVTDGMQISVKRLPFTFQDGTILASLACVHGLIFWGNWCIGGAPRRKKQRLLEG
jgi:hypothetical protein